MSDTSQPVPGPAPTQATHEERVLPAVAYVLYLVGLPHGITIFFALLVAYFNRADASPKMQTHYTFIIRTFWLSIGWFLIGAAVFAVGIPLSIVLIGLPMMAVGGTICASVVVWSAVRCLVGGYYLLKDEPYPRPQAWLF